MNFRRHQIPQILGEIKEILEKNTIDEELKKEEPQFTYEISKFILENIDPNPKIKIHCINYPEIYIDVKDSKYYYCDPISYESSQLYEFKSLLNKLNIYLYWHNAICNEKYYDLIQLDQYTGKHTCSEITQYFTSIDKIPDQLYNKTIWPGHDNQEAQDHFNQLVDTLLEQQYTKPTYHIAQWFKDNNIQTQITLYKYDGNNNINCFNVNTYPRINYERIKELLQYLRQFDDISVYKLKDMHLNRCACNIISVDFQDPPQSLPTIEQIPDQLFIKGYYDNNDNYVELSYQYYIDYLFQQLNSQQPKVKYPEQVKQIKDLLNKYNYKYYYHNEQYNYYTFCKELDKNDVQNEETLFTSIVQFKSKNEIELCRYGYTLREKIYNDLKPITDDFLNMIFGGYKLIQDIEQCEKTLRDEYGIRYTFKNIQPTYYISNYIKQHYKNIPIKYERCPYSTDTYFIVIDINFDNEQNNFKELEKLLNVDNILLDYYKSGIKLNIKTTNRQIIPAIDDIPDLFFISQYSVNGKTYSRSPLLDQYEQTMYNNARNSFMKQIKEQLYDKYDCCFIFREDSYIEFINKNQLQGILLKRDYNNNTICSQVFGINSFDQYTEPKDRKPATFEQVQNLLQKYLDQGYIVENKFLEWKPKEIHDPKKEQPQFTYEISKFILENIDSKPTIEMQGRHICINLKHSKYYYEDPVSHDHLQRYEFKSLLEKLKIHIWWFTASYDGKQYYDIIALDQYTGKHSYDEFKQYFTSIDKIPDQLYNRTIWSQQYTQEDQDYFNQLVDTLLEQNTKKADHKIFIANKQLLVIDDKLITLMKKDNDKLYASKPFKIASIQEHFGKEYSKQFQEISKFDLTNMILCDCVNREIIEQLIQ